MARSLGMGVLGGAATMLTRNVTRRAMHDRRGAPKLPAATRRGRGIKAMLAWAAVAGVVLAIADVMQEQRKATARQS